LVYFVDFNDSRRSEPGKFDNRRGKTKGGLGFRKKAVKNDLFQLSAGRRS
jgi:hypothetical protein